MFGYQAERRRIAKLMGVDYLWFGLFGQFMGAMLMGAAPDAMSAPMFAGEAGLVLSTGVLVGGCAMYARYHGLRRACALLGMLSVVGVVILTMLPARQKERKAGQGFSVIFAEPYRRDVWRMDVRVKLDEKIGTGVREPIMLQLPRGACVGNAMKTLAGVIPELQEGDLPGVEFAINGQRVDRKAELSNGDEVAVTKISTAPLSRSENSTSPA